MSKIYNKIQKRNGEIYIDLTNDTVTPSTLLEGYTAHDASGAIIMGSLNLDDYISEHYKGIYRGIELGSGSTFATAATTDQKNAIDSGTFKGIFIGDYWTINNRIYRVADFDYWNSDIHHVVLMPDAALVRSKFNATNDTSGGYLNSAIRTSDSGGISVALSIIDSAFSGYTMLTSHNLLNLTINNDVITPSLEVASSYIELPSYSMIFGGPFTTPNYNMPQGSADLAQLQLFALNKKHLMAPQYHTWLRDIWSATEVLSLRRSGIVLNRIASDTNDVRPVFAIQCSG